MENNRTQEGRLQSEIQRTLEIYDHDPVLIGDPALASSIIEQRNVPRVLTGWNTLRRFEFGIAAVIVMLLLNIITVFYVSGGLHRTEPAQDVVTQLSSEYEIDQIQNNDVR